MLAFRPFGPPYEPINWFLHLQAPRPDLGDRFYIDVPAMDALYCWLVSMVG